MIAELSIRNFAIIEELHLQFHEGLNVLTGETGAGKSILLDALGLLLGGRGSAEWVRHGEKKAEIEGLFFLQEDSPAIAKFRELGIGIEDLQVVIRRDLNIQGKSICRINGQLVPISALREIGELLVNFHCQQDHHQLLQIHRHQDWLDAFGGKELKALLAEYGEMYRKYAKMRKELEYLTQNEKAMMQRLDLLRFQLEEIREANLEIGEDERLSQERKLLVHGEKIAHSVHGAYEALTGEQKCLDWLGMAMAHLEEAGEYDPKLKEWFRQVEEVFYVLEEISRELGHYADDIEFDEGRLAAVEERLALIQGMKRKYGDSIPAILEYAAQVEEELEQLENRDALLLRIAEELNGLKKDLLLQAKEITELRIKVGRQLAEGLRKELQDLHMPNVKFAVRVEDLSRTASVHGWDLPGGSNGMNEVEFLIATNPGEPLKPLARIASGGELSRIALALRTVFARMDAVDTLVFDEVDTGVSGAVCQAIGEKLSRIAEGRQVLAITHHPQVASFADAHFLIEKKVKGKRTVTEVVQLDEERRIDELARMIGGRAELSPSARLHAAEMLRLAKETKKAVRQTFA